MTREQHINAAGQITSQETYGFDLAGNRTNKTVWSGTTPLMTVNYSLGTGNRLASWSVTQTDLVGQVDVAGTSSETIGTNDRFGWLYVSNLNGRASIKPYVAGTNFWNREPGRSRNRDVLCNYLKRNVKWRNWHTKRPHCPGRCVSGGLVSSTSSRHP